MSTVCPFKIIERLIYARVETIINPLLPQEHAGFRHYRSTVDRVTLLTQDIEDSFLTKKAGVCRSYSSLRHCMTSQSHPQKLLRLLPDRHMVRMIMELFGNCSFTLTTGNNKWSRLRHLKNGVQQGSVLAPFLFNIYTFDLPITVSRKYAYADDLAITHADGDWQAVEGVLSKDMATLGGYLQTWKWKLSTTKTVSAAFHLNKEAKLVLKVNLNDEALLLRAQIPRSNVRQVTHIPPVSRVTSQKVDITRSHFWRSQLALANNVANSHLSPGPHNSRVLRSCLVP